MPAPTSPTPLPPSLDEIRGLLTGLPGPDLAAATAATLKAKESGRAGDAAHEPAEWLASWQGHHPPRLARPRLCLFAAAHGASARSAGARAAIPLGDRIAAVVDGAAPVVAAAEAIDADLRLYELNWQRPSGDITREPAMDEATCATALTYGMMAVEDHIDVLALATLSEGDGIAARAIGLTLFGGAPADWAPAGEAALLESAIARHGAGERDPFELLRRLGGEDIAAIAGAILAARLARTPVVLDGAAALAAAAVLERAAHGTIAHCRWTGQGDDAATKLAAELGLPAAAPLVAVSPGDGTAGAEAVKALRGALARHLAST